MKAYWSAFVRRLPALRTLGGMVLLVLLGVWLGRHKKTEPPPVVALSPPPSDEKLRLNAAALQKNRIETAVAARVRLAKDVEVVGSVSYDADHFAEVGPLIPGRIVSLLAGIGDPVQRGQVLGHLESAEVGQAQAAYLTARAAATAAHANLRRERELAERLVSSVRERELAEAAAAIEEANLLAATQRLRALGLRIEDIKVLERRLAGPSAAGQSDPRRGADPRSFVGPSRSIGQRCLSGRRPIAPVGGFGPV